jgi:putative toxin-antitoxin system antitoxin component (TIGR02293 family)
MAACVEGETSAPEVAVIERTADLLGGSRIFPRRLHGPLDVHEALNRGLPREALAHLIGNVRVLHDQVLVKSAIGMSLRTSQRAKVTAGKPLSKEQSGRVWKFAEILAKATAVFGSQREAERWLERPAIGLDQRRPIDLLATPAGVQLVEDFLGRLKYGVYT